MTADLDQSAIIAAANRRYGTDGYNPREVLRYRTEAIAIGRARDEYGRACDRALSAYDRTISGALMQLENDRRRAYDETMRLCEPARRICMEELHRAARLREDQPELTEEQYDTLVTTIRLSYDQAVAPLLRTHDRLIAEAYREHEAAVQRAKAAYDGLMAGARARYDEAVTEATRDAHERGDHAHCDPNRCAVAAAQTI